ncbi:MAG: NADP-dependent oxidoreductase [Candidatus Marinimicrobia bacterium]|jgi:hypothetical protein|nr:NADP-dependent oxidoreductase [Candidatus Neomarinimicrobiota bacterium]MBT3676125.1 NADP-dependent oxidoreductase [Candidatus Neomarinimicrobiota bacterium]MBT3763030.1 NADP-dependent oxidoreductase [Candidatus Neomarinimicrobiota bacterium]MBT4068671.1 NADP-dependent oxidoreductase [Candidatus Neomarinimicrobiota bacterium]MBT4270740.1 NADP-dependent oxidoreductase [Candidatus Neomarinimicrobiota bacterium]
MSHPQNKQFKLISRPIGMPTRENFEYSELSTPSLKEGELLVQSKYISLDPAMRGWMNDGKSYIPPVGLGEVMRAGGVGEVLESNNPKFIKGDFVQGLLGVQSHPISNGEQLTKIDPNLAPLPLYLSLFGLTGMTAYFGLLSVGEPKEGDTVLVSGAAGATGSVVGQIAKIKGCRVVGIAGGQEKCDYIINELGFDAAIDYKSDNLLRALKTSCPDGVDVFFDNVGGDILNLVLTQINMNARVVICGAISQYNNTTPIKGPDNYLSLLVNRARMQGFIVFDFASQYGEAAKQMGQWLAEGKLKSKEHIVEGIDTFPETLLMLFSGENFGKLMLKV